MVKQLEDLSVIQKVYDFTLWYVPIVSRLPRDHKFTLGDRVVNLLYDIHEELLRAKYEKEKLPRLQRINLELEVLRHRTRLLRDFKLLSPERYYFAAQAINASRTGAQASPLAVSGDSREKASHYHAS
jgi:hypothetical protein